MTPDSNSPAANDPIKPENDLRSLAAEALSRTSLAPEGAVDPFATTSHSAGTNDRAVPTWIKSQKTGGQQPIGWLILLALSLMLIGMLLGNFWLGFAGSIVALLLSAQVIWSAVRDAFQELLSPAQRLLTLSVGGLVLAAIGLLKITGANRRIGVWYVSLNWDAIGATGEVIGAVGQILIAVLGGLCGMATVCDRQRFDDSAKPDHAAANDRLLLSRNL